MKHEPIKIGRNEYQPQKGDYILFNGACYQFCSGDRRTLLQKGFDSYTSLGISMTALKKIEFDELNIVKKGNFIYYYFL